MFVNWPSLTNSGISNVKRKMSGSHKMSHRVYCYTRYICGCTLVSNLINDKAVLFIQAKHS